MTTSHVRPSQPVRRALATVALAAVACTIAAGGPARALPVSFVCEAPATGRVVRLASLPAQDWKRGHRGIDLAASLDEIVVAPAAGTVTVAGVIVDRPVVAIRHADGFVSALEPVSPSVGVGDEVAKGQPVGAVAPGNGHCAPGTCVHWGLRKDGRYVDPLDYLEEFGPVRLLPVTAG